MRRRDFIAGVGAISGWPAVARAQTSQRRRRIGGVGQGDPPPAGDLELVRELARLGYVEGRTVDYIVRGAGEGAPEQIAAVIRDLLAATPDVMTGPGTSF